MTNNQIWNSNLTKRQKTQLCYTTIVSLRIAQFKFWEMEKNNLKEAEIMYENSVSSWEKAGRPQDINIQF